MPAAVGPAPHPARPKHEQRAERREREGRRQRARAVARGGKRRLLVGAAGARPVLLPHGGEGVVALDLVVGARGVLRSLPVLERVALALRCGGQLNRVAHARLDGDAAGLAVQRAAGQVEGERHLLGGPRPGSRRSQPR